MLWRKGYVFLLAIVVFSLWLLMVVLVVRERPRALQESLLTAQKVIKTKPDRGIFYDRNAVKLTNNNIHYRLTLSNDSRSLRQSISQILKRAEMESSEYYQKNIDGFVAQGYITLSQKILLQANMLPAELEQLSFAEQPLRSYPYIELAHLIGYVGKPDLEDVRAGAETEGYVGKYGLEQLLEPQLKGLGQQQLLQIAEGSLRGDDVVLTIDLNWQTSLSKILSEEMQKLGALGAAAIVINQNNGEVIASVNSPSFDPNKFVGGISQTEYQQLVNDTGLPLTDKVFGWQASPGSTLKPLAAYSLVSREVITFDTSYYSAGCMVLGQSKFCEIDSRRLGSLRLHDAIVRSSNIYFCNAAIKLSTTSGIDTLLQDLQQLGLGLRPQWPVAAAAGQLGGPNFKQLQLKESWYDGDSCNTVIGQGFVLASPGQMAYAFATLLNGGTLYKPQILKQIGEKPEGPQVIKKLSIDGQLVSKIANGMRDVVNDRRGSAYALAKLPKELNLKAKTGSAEATEYINGTQKSGTHSWVVVVFDYKGESYILTVFFRFGGRSVKSLPTAERFLNCISANRCS